MPRRSPNNEKSPPKLGSNQAGKKKVGSTSIAPPRAQGKIQAPRDPILRAIWKVGQAADLTPQERLAYLALWRYLGSDTKPLGAALLGKLLSLSTTRAADIFSSLQRKGYLNSTGKFQSQGGRTSRADRGLTEKLSLPKSGSPRGKTRRESRRTQKSEPVGISGYSSVGIPEPDLGGYTRSGCVPSAQTTPTVDGTAHAAHTVRIVDILAATDDGEPVKSSKGGAA